MSMDPSKIPTEHCKDCTCILLWTSHRHSISAKQCETPTRRAGDPARDLGPGQRPAVGSVTFNHLVERQNLVDVQNTTTTFTITVNP